MRVVLEDKDGVKVTMEMIERLFEGEETVEGVLEELAERRDKGYDPLAEAEKVARKRPSVHDIDTVEELLSGKSLEEALKELEDKEGEIGGEEEDVLGMRGTVSGER